MRKLATAALSFSAAVFIAQYLLASRVLPYAAGAAAVLGLAALFLRGNKRTRVALLGFGAAFGFIWHYGYNLIMMSPAEELVGQTLRVTVRAVDYSYTDGEYGSVYVTLAGDGLPSVKMQLYSYGGVIDGIEPGDTFTVQAEFISAQRVNGADTDQYTSRGIFLRARAIGALENPGRWSLSFLYFPKVIALRIKQAALNAFPGDAAAYMIALLTGDRTLLKTDYELYNAMSVSGVMHVVAVSGMHIAFLIGFVRQFTGKKSRTALIGIPLICIFIPMAGSSPSVIRAGFMQIALLTAPLIKRENDSITSLSAVLAALLLVNPASCASVSLQLSFAAMAGIILLTPRISGAMASAASGTGLAERRFAGRAARVVISSFSSTIGALALSTPLVAWHFGYVSLISPITNLITLPVISVCFSLGYVVCIAQMLLPVIGGALGWALAWPVRYIIVAVKLMSKAPYASVYTENAYIVAWLICAYAIFAFSYLLRGKTGYRPATPVSLAVITLCASLVLINAGSRRVSCTVTAVDVGQGQSLAILTADTTVVIDCGGGYAAGAAGSMAQYLISEGRSSVDAVILTHLHADHANGVSRLLSYIDVGYLILPYGTDDGDGLAEEITAAATGRGTEIIYISEDSLFKSGMLEITLYAPIGTGGENERGLFILASAGDFDVLVTGDSGTEVERRMMARALFSDIEVLIAGHHGSETSNSSRLLQAAQPDIVLVSVGSNNAYGHPSDGALERFGQVEARVYRTDLHGSVSVNSW